MTDWLRGKDYALTELASDLAAGLDQTSVNVVDAGRLPADFTYPLTIWDGDTYRNPGDDPDREVVLVSAAAGNLLTVARGQEGTAAVAHTAGSYAGVMAGWGYLAQLQAAVDEVQAQLNAERSTQIIHLRPSQAELPASGAATFTQVQGNNFPYSVLLFQDGAVNDAYWNFTVPEAWDGSNPTMRMYWLTTVTTEAVLAMSNWVTAAGHDDVFDATGLPSGMGGTPAYGGPTVAAGDLIVTESEWSINLPSPGDLCVMKVRRAGQNAADTVNEATKLLAIKLEFKCNR